MSDPSNSPPEKPELSNVIGKVEQHLEEALDAPDDAEQEYHIRQALQQLQTIQDQS